MDARARADSFVVSCAEAARSSNRATREAQSRSCRAQWIIAKKRNKRKNTKASRSSHAACSQPPKRRRRAGALTAQGTLDATSATRGFAAAKPNRAPTCARLPRATTRASDSPERSTTASATTASSDLGTEQTNRRDSCLEPLLEPCQTGAMKPARHAAAPVHVSANTRWKLSPSTFSIVRAL